MMKMALRVFSFFYSIYALVTFVAIMLLIFPFALLANFSWRIKGGNRIYRLCMIWADIWFPLIGVWHKKIYEAPHDKTKSYIFVSNHISYLDAAIIPKAYRQPVRPLGKVETANIPVFGFIYRNVIVTVDRSSKDNRARSLLLLRSILGKGISVIVFPEGTFNMTQQPLKEFYDGAFRLAIETQTPVKPVLFLDAYRRMPYESLFRMTPGPSRLVYLDEIPVNNYTTVDTAALRDKVYALMEEKLVQYKAARKPA